MICRYGDKFKVRYQHLCILRPTIRLPLDLKINNYAMCYPRTTVPKNPMYGSSSTIFPI